MRAAFFLLLACASCDSATARVHVDGVNAVRRPDGFVDVYVDVTGVDQSGRDVGTFCVSAHWLPQGTDTGLLSEQPTYFGESDHVVTCLQGLDDGDKRTIHLVSSISTTPKDVPVRGQAGIRDAIDSMDTTNP